MLTTLLYAACAWLAWTPAENATHYDVYEDLIYSTTVIDPTVEVCRLAYYQPVVYHVVGLNDAEEESPPSDSLEVEWVWDFDAVGTPVVGFADFGQFANAFGSSNPDFDADEDGVIGMADFGLFASRWGECNDGQKVVPCSEVFP